MPVSEMVHRGGVGGGNGVIALLTKFISFLCHRSFKSPGIQMNNSTGFNGK